MKNLIYLKSLKASKSSRTTDAIRAICFTSLILLMGCKAKNDVALDPDIYYTCSMDPQVVEYKPGTCPICKMDLTAVKKRKGEKQDEIQLSDQQIQLGNIKTDTLRSAYISDRMVLTGTLNFDQLKSKAVSARIMGRIERLYFKNLGDYVKEGTPLYDLYSEELNSAKQEYLLLLDKQKSFSGGSVIDFDQLLQSAKNKLILWGMSETQVRELTSLGKISQITTFFSPVSGYITTMDIMEGEYTMEGGRVVIITDLSTLWAEAQVYASQMASVDQNSIATIQLPEFDGRVIRGRVEFVNPEINPDTRINLIRVSIPNPGNQLKPGMPAYVLLNSPQRRSLILPIDAVIRDGKGATVWLKTDHNTYRSVMITTGLESDDQIEIYSGLKEGDIVVLSGAYLLHSEYVFKKGSDPMAAHNH